MYVTAESDFIVPETVHSLIRWAVAFLSLFPLTANSCSPVSSLLLNSDISPHSSVQVSPWIIYRVPVYTGSGLLPFLLRLLPSIRSFFFSP